jgi:2-polyprenyl-6-methoxyphenol hydroxylase-like FAD-dependent oxidoreductase
LRVLISGAGIAGSTLAWFLAKAGARITVIEKSAALLPRSRRPVRPSFHPAAIPASPSALRL